MKRKKGVREPNTRESPSPRAPKAWVAESESVKITELAPCGRPMLMQDTALRTLFRKSIPRFACLAPPNTTTAALPRLPTRCPAVHSFQFQLTLSRSLFPTICSTLAATSRPHLGSPTRSSLSQSAGSHATPGARQQRAYLAALPSIVGLPGAHQRRAHASFPFPSRPPPRIHRSPSRAAGVETPEKPMKSLASR